MPSQFWKVLTLFFLGAIFVAVMTHAKGFSTAAGTLFTGINTLGGTLEAAGTAQKLCAGTIAFPIPDRLFTRTTVYLCIPILTRCRVTTTA